MVIWRYPVEVIINIILAKSVYSSLTFNYLITLRYDPTGMMVIPYIPPLKPWVNPHWTLLLNREGNSLTYSSHTNKNECINLQLGRDTHLLTSYSPFITNWNTFKSLKVRVECSTARLRIDQSPSWERSLILKSLTQLSKTNYNLNIL